MERSIVFHLTLETISPIRVEATSTMALILELTSSDPQTGFRIAFNILLSLTLLLTMVGSFKR